MQCVTLGHTVACWEYSKLIKIRVFSWHLITKTVTVRTMAGNMSAPWGVLVAHCLSLFLWNFWTSKWNFLRCCQCLWLLCLHFLNIYFTSHMLLASTCRVWWKNQENLRRGSNSHVQITPWLLYIELYLVTFWFPATNTVSEAVSSNLHIASVNYAVQQWTTVSVYQNMFKIIIIKAISHNKWCVMALCGIIRSCIYSHAAKAYNILKDNNCM